MQTVRRILGVVLLLCMLLGLAAAVPSGIISEEAQDRYMEEFE